MPQYEYQCKHCGKVKTEYRSVEDRDVCPICDKCEDNISMNRILSPSLFIINGYNYRNGYSKKES